jgi:hypothetical protein
MELGKLFRDSRTVEVRKGDRFQLEEMLDKLNWRARQQLLKEYVLPVVGDEAAKRVATELSAESDAVQRQLQEIEAIDAAERRTRTIARGLEMQREALKQVSNSDKLAKFDDDPLIAVLWRTAVVNAGMQIVNSGPQVPGRADVDLDQLLKMHLDFRGEEGTGWDLQER